MKWEISDVEDKLANRVPNNLDKSSIDDTKEFFELDIYGGVYHMRLLTIEVQDLSAYIRRRTTLPRTLSSRH